MKISFDLDDTLILTDKGALYEAPVKKIKAIFYKEKLRKGIRNLCEELKSLGYDICVYTTSERGIGYIRGLFDVYGIKLHDIINQKVHRELVQGNRKEIMPSKVPSKFGVDLHIDDDISVKHNGTQFGFRVLIISKDDNEWRQKVLNEAKRVKKICDSL
ncbi:HAD family hydrolase [Acetivibrio mesophilus]|uniref:HAD family hydrolase n=1 Tax=Acetivibrio mesophilus TaxID=2487273 RepID=A0A4Q0I2E3_9FIRM|nr:HAD family hydrolase [Acetivibrio mesophilus]RXE58356.1 HAD family hydrolase [Acetivibrio mesophilus]